MKLILQKALSQSWNVFKKLLPPLTSVKKHSYLGKWEQPQGYDSGVKIHNSTVNKKVPLILKNKGIATWYVCGPTVYAESHIGHACCYVKFDTIRRIMQNIFNIHVVFLMGITDIDDKIIKKSVEAKVSASEIARCYEFEFFEDMAAMQVQAPTVVARVTENISLIIEFCKKLVEKEFAYVTEKGNVYFCVSKSASADILNEMPDDSPVLSDPLKRDKRDFALWKSAKPNEPCWLSPWGNGRPGWHIECSAIASNTFGSQLDIHSGGYDLLFPHHANEKSQSEAYHGCSQWVNYWLHSGLLQVEDDIKMSKSLHNTISIKDFLKDNSVNDFRILCLQSLYRKNISFCNETLYGAKGLHKKLHNFINDCELYLNEKHRIHPDAEAKVMTKLEFTQEKIVSVLADDFNTSQALLCLTDLVDEVNMALQSSLSSTPSDMQGVTAIASCLNYVTYILEVWGIQIMSKKKLNREFIHLIDNIVEFRNDIRMFALCQVKQGSSSSTQFIVDAYKNVKVSSSHLPKSKDFSSKIAEIILSINLFYEESQEFTSTVLDLNSDLVSVDKTDLKTEKKKRSHLLSLCDSLRTTLEGHGIAIKDKKNSSSWHPLMTLQL